MVMVKKAKRWFVVIFKQLRMTPQLGNVALLQLSNRAQIYSDRTVCKMVRIFY